METMSLNATIRTDFGKGAARKLRGTGQLPAVVYRAGQEALSVTITNADLETIFRKTMNRNTLVKVETGDDSRVCLVKEVQRHPVSRAIRHVDFYEVDESEQVEVVVKVVPVGTAVGTKLGGRLQLLQRDLKILCKPADIPAEVSVDVSDLAVNDILRVSQVDAPKGCKISYIHDFNIATVVGKRVAAAEEELEGEGGEEAAAAEGEAAETNQD